MPEPGDFSSDQGRANSPSEADAAWAQLVDEFDTICLDEHGGVWVMLHSGSRGVGNATGTMLIELAKKDAELH